MTWVLVIGGLLLLLGVAYLFLSSGAPVANPATPQNQVVSTLGSKTNGFGSVTTYRLAGGGQESVGSYSAQNGNTGQARVAQANALGHAGVTVSGTGQQPVPGIGIVPVPFVLTPSQLAAAPSGWTAQETNNWGASNIWDAINSAFVAQFGGGGLPPYPGLASSGQISSVLKLANPPSPSGSVVG